MDPELVEGPIKIRHAGLFFNEDLSVGCLFFLRYYNFFARSWAAWPRPPVLIWSLLVVLFHNIAFTEFEIRSFNNNYSLNASPLGLKQEDW